MIKSSKLLMLLAPIGLLAIASLSQVEAQRFAPGYCPTVAAHENFDKTKFFGNWIEVEKTPSIFDLMMRCLVVDYSDDQDNTVNVVVRGVSLAGLPLTVNGDGLLQDVHRSGFYSIRYGFGVPFQGTLTTILDTDYEDYAVVYSCTNSLLSGVFHSEYIWVLSRSGKISNPTRQNIYEKLDKLQINRSGLTMSDRSSCPSNSSMIARESDKDLASQQNGQQASLGGAAAGSSAAASGSAAGAAEQGVAASSSGPSAQLERANGVEPTQKSVVVPLLYDLPSPVSSSSVGSSNKQSAKQSPPAPVDNKIPQLPVSLDRSRVGAAQKPAQAAPAASPAADKASPASGQQVTSGQQKPSQSQKQQDVAASQADKQQQQQQSADKQQSSLLNKIQPKK